MTVAVGIPVYRYAGNDSATNFPFTQIFHNTADLVVIRTDSGGNNITLVKDTDYTVNGVDTAAGSVDFPIASSAYYPDPLATGYLLTIIRASDKGRTTDMSAAFFFENLNLGEDKTVMMIQELAEQLSRCSKYEESNTATPPNLEELISTPAPDITKIIQFRVFPSDTDVAVGDGTVFALIDAEYDGWSVTDVSAVNYVKGVATGAETLDIQIRKKKISDDSVVDVLTTKVTIGDERYAADGSVNVANAVLAAGDILLSDIDTAHLTTPPLGLTVNVKIQAP